MKEFEQQFAKAVGKEIKKAMLDADVLIKDIAELFNVSTPCVSQLLNAKRPLTVWKVKLICKKCNITLSQLFERAGL